MSIVARLTAVLGADSAKFEEGMKRASKSMKEFESVISTGAKYAAGALATVTAGLTALTIKQMGAIDSTNKLAQSLGVNVRNFQALAMVAGEAGVEQEGLTKAITTSGKKLVEAATGSKTAASAFKALGLNVNELLKLSPDKQFEAIGTALSKVENPTLKTSLAMELFGKNGRAVLVMLTDLGLKIEEARAFNDKFNVSLSELDGAKVEEANDAFGRLGLALNGLGNTLAVKVSPLITAVSQSLLDAGVSGDTFAKAVDTAFKFVGDALDMIRVAGYGIIKIFNDVHKAIISVIADANYGLYKLSQSIQSIAGLEGVGQTIEGATRSTQQWLEGQAKGIKEVSKSLSEYADNFEEIETKILKATTAANTRASLTVKKTSSSRLSPFIQDSSETSVRQTTQALNTLQTTAEAAQDAQIDYNNILKESFQELAGAMTAGGNAAEKFKTIALNAIQKVATALINQVFNVGGSSSGGGGILGQLVGGLGGIFGGGGSTSGWGLGAWAGSGTMASFDVGTDYVPRDMVAKIHKGEMIIPADEAANMRRGTGANVVQNITIGAGVSGAVRQEVLRMLPDIRKATIQGVSDASMRGAI